MSSEKNKNLCEGCTICCEHITVEIDKPKTREEILKLVDYLRYKDILIFIEDGGEWNIEFKTICRQLNEKGLCKIYKNRPKICRDYHHDKCERYGEGEFYKHIFRNEKELLDFIKKNKKLNKIFLGQ